MNNVSSGHKAGEESNRGLGDRGLVVEFNDDWQIDHQPQNVRRVHCSLATESGNAAENNDTVNSVLIAKDIEYFLHERLLAAMIRFFEIDADDHHLVFHERDLYRLRAM
jgi:hypothetical protein